MNLAVFLLAGRGSRLSEYTEDIPKCLVEVQGKPILHLMLDKLSLKGTGKSILVIGYLGEKIIDSVGYSWKGMQIEYVINEIWESTNNIYSLFLANEKINEDFILFEGDIIISGEAFEKLKGEPNFMAVSKWAPHLDGSMVELKNKMITRFYLKKDIPSSTDIKSLYKTVNIYGLDINDYTGKIIPEMKRIIDKGETGIYYEKAFANLVNEDKLDFRAIDFSDNKWAEIDNEEDLKLTNRIFSA